MLALGDHDIRTNVLALFSNIRGGSKTLFFQIEKFRYFSENLTYFMMFCKFFFLILVISAQSPCILNERVSYLKCYKGVHDLNSPFGEKTLTVAS